MFVSVKIVYVTRFDYLWGSIDMHSYEKLSCYFPVSWNNLLFISYYKVNINAVIMQKSLGNIPENKNNKLQMWHMICFSRDDSSRRTKDNYLSENNKSCHLINAATPKMLTVNFHVMEPNPGFTEPSAVNFPWQTGSSLFPWLWILRRQDVLTALASGPDTRSDHNWAIRAT